LTDGLIAALPSLWQGYYFLWFVFPAITMAGLLLSWGWFFFG